LIFDLENTWKNVDQPTWDHGEINMIHMERWRRGFCQALNRESRIERQPLVSAHPLQLTPAQVGQIAHIALCPTEWTYLYWNHFIWMKYIFCSPKRKRSYPNKRLKVLLDSRTLLIFRRKTTWHVRVANQNQAAGFWSSVWSYLS
jgi:hypothetical protein